MTNNTKNAKKDNGRRWTHAVMNNMLDVLDQGVAAEGSCCTRSTFVNEAIKEKAQRSVAAAKRYRQAQAYWSYFNGSTRLGEPPLSYEDWLAQRSQVDDAKEQGPASQPEPVAKVTTQGNDTNPIRGSITSDAVLAELGISPDGVASNPFEDLPPHTDEMLEADRAERARLLQKHRDEHGEPHWLELEKAGNPFGDEEVGS